METFRPLVDVLIRMSTGHAAQCMNVALCGVRGVGVEPCLAQLCVCVNGSRLKGARAAVLLLS